MIRLLLVLLLLPAPAWAATFYVATTGNNANSCLTSQTIGTPKQTLASAIPCLAAGDTLLIRAGSYTGFTQANFTGDGINWTTGAITISGYPAETVTLTSNGGENAITFNDDTRHYIIVKDLRIVDYNISINAEDSDHLRFQNIEIIDAPHNGVFAGGSFHEFIDLNVHGAGRLAGDTPTSDCDNGMYLWGDNFTVRGGSFWNNQSFGIRLYESAAGIATNGVIERARFYQNGAGIGLEGTSTSLCGGGGVVVAETSPIVQNSLIYRNYAGVLVYGFSDAATDAKIWHNTITGNVNTGLEIMAGVTNTLVTNNILFNNGVGVDYVNNGTGTVATGSFTANPTFTNAASDDYTLQASSTAINAGVVLGLAEDFAGQTRPSGSAPDPGAYEFQEGAPPSPDPGSPRLRFTTS